MSGDYVVGKKVEEELLGMFWESFPAFGGGFLFLGYDVNIDGRFNAFAHFLEEHIGLD